MSNGQFKFAILSACGNPVTATPKPPVKATLACKQLLLTPGTIETNGDQDYSFTASASSTNSSIASYIFNLGNGSSQTVTTSAKSAKSKTVTYAPGTYKVSVKVTGVAANDYTSAPASVSCTGSFTVKPNGTLSCNTLSLNDISTSSTTGDVTYTLTAQATAANATISKYVFNFGDTNNTAQTVTTSATSATSQSFVYTAGQTYSSIYVTVSGKSNNGNAVTAGGAGTSCSTNLTVPPQTCATGSTASSCKPTCTSPTNGQTYPAGSSQCTPPKTCTSPTTGKTYPIGSSQCALTPVTPTTPTTPLPNTGPGNVIGLFAGVSIVGALGYRFFLSRKLARNASF
jgi:hypothetical protein